MYGRTLTHAFGGPRGFEPSLVGVNRERQDRFVTNNDAQVGTSLLCLTTICADIVWHFGTVTFRFPPTTGVTSPVKFPPLVCIMDRVVVGRS